MVHHQQPATPAGKGASSNFDGNIDMDESVSRTAQPPSSEQNAIANSGNTDDMPNGKAQDHQRGFRFWAIIIGLGVTNLLGALENTVVTTSAPTIVTDLNLGENYVWITNAFFLCSAAFQPLFGQLANIFGRRWVTLVIVAIFTFGSGICGGATTGGMLIAGRAVQGVGSGGIIMIIDIIVSDLVPLRERGNYMAVILAIYGIGTSMGPFIGGILVQTTTWRWVFYINLPIGGAAFVILFLFLHVNYNKEMSFSQKMKRIDFVGNLILMACSVAILWALTNGGSRYVWSSPRIAVPLAMGLFGLVVFGAFENWGFSPEPVMPFRLFANRTSIIVAINTWLNSLLVYWVIYFLPVYFQAVRGSSPARAGVQVLATSLVGIPGAAISAIVLSRWGRYKPLHWTGFALFTIGMGLFSLQRRDSSTAQWVIYQCVAALGAGMVLNTLLPSFQAPISEADQAAGTAAWCFIRTFGSVWGVAIPAVIFNNRFDQLSSRIVDPTVRALLSNGHAYEHASRDFINSLPLPVKDQTISVFSDALELVFRVGIAFSGLAFCLVFFEKHIPLRTELETEYGLKETRKEKPQTDRDIEGGVTEKDGGAVVSAEGIIRTKHNSIRGEPT